MSNPTPTAPIPDKSTVVVASPSSTSSMGNKDGTTKQAVLRCPRCDSSNTKFCYYNNYSLSQPRHFCKTCRRYWTQGGALRNVPVGGGCRKNKKLKSSSSSSSTAMDHFGLPSLYGPFGTNPNPNPNPNNRFGVEPSVLTMGFMGPNQLDMAGHVTNFVHQSSSLASSIESLSCINQDMHWKLQQQRLSVFFAGDIQNKQATRVSTIPTHQLQDPNPIDHQLFSSSANSASNKGREEWLFVNSGSSVNPNLTDGGGGGGGGFGDQGNPNWSNGVQATWTTTLP